MDDFIRGFFACALWSSNDESREDGGDPLDDNYTVDDIDEACREALELECERFVRDNAAQLTGWKGKGHTLLEQAGHDFWLTRNGHGCGFLDGGWPEHGDHLTKASKAYGEVDLIVGDDGKIYAGGYENGVPREPDTSRHGAS